MSRKLTPAEELAFLRELADDPRAERALAVLRDAFNVLQARSQLLLGLVTICLTITGFSGPRIAQSGAAAGIAIFFGVINVLITAVLLVIGPLNLRWMTQFRAETVDATLTGLIERRNRRTRLYHLATGFLLIGVAGYILSLACYLLSPH